MKEQKIYSVSEAFSIQPMIWIDDHICSTGRPLKNIRIESIYDTGYPYDFYVGYDSSGDKVFQIRVQCATVQFYNTTTEQ